MTHFVFSISLDLMFGCWLSYRGDRPITLSEMEDGRIDRLPVVADRRAAVTFAGARTSVAVHPWVVGEASNATQLHFLV